MQTLNKKATRIFCALLAKTNGEQYTQLTSGRADPLTIERVQTGIRFLGATASHYLLGHYYPHQDGLIPDPVIGFLVIDHRRHPADLERIDIYPQSFQQNSVGQYEIGIHYVDRRVTYELTEYQHRHTTFANLLLSIFEQEGFLHEPNPGTPPDNKGLPQP